MHPEKLMTFDDGPEPPIADRPEPEPVGLTVVTVHKVGMNCFTQFDPRADKLLVTHCFDGSSSTMSCVL